MQTYICKCGRSFTKSSKSASTGFSLSYYQKEHECYGCPYVVKYRDWQTQEVTKWECRATPNIEYKTYCSIGTADKDFHAARFFTLDLEFAKRVYTRCQQLDGCGPCAKGNITANTAYEANTMPAEWRAADFDNEFGLIKFPLVFENNGTGTSARKIIYNEFFSIPCNDEENKIKTDICRAIAAANDETEEMVMARKFNFDSGITKDLKAAAADSFVDNLKMIDVVNLIPSDDNFYAMTEIEELADDIERQGLKHNLVVSARSDGKYDIISGHRRYTAKQLLISQQRSSSSTLPCYIYSKAGKTDADVKLDLIMLNATQRKYTDIDLKKEYEELVSVYEQLKAEGKNIKGNTRDNIAAALKVSPAQIGKLENIQHNAAPEVQEAVNRGEMTISTANEVAKLDTAVQKEIIKKNEKEKVTRKEVEALKPTSDAAPKKKQEKVDTSINFTSENSNVDTSINLEPTTATNKKADRVEMLIEHLEDNPLWDLRDSNDEILFNADEFNDLIIAALQAYKIALQNRS